MQPLTDSFGRRISYLRLSVTDRCDLRCVYCMSEKMTFLPRKDLLTLEELETLAGHFIVRGVDTIRITGGEPLLRKNILSLFRGLSHFLRGGSLKELTLTTNGTRLDQYAGELSECGVRRVNVSLDTLCPERYRRLTRGGDIAEALNGIKAASDCGLAVKVNVVALRDENVEEIPEIIEWAHGQGHDVSLIEAMPMGETGYSREEHRQLLDDVRDRLSARWKLTDIARRTAGPSRYTKIAETGGAVGFITPLSNNFCAGCNRVRVSCTGTLYGCLGRSHHVELRSALREGGDINALLNDAIAGKPERHDFLNATANRPAVTRHMSVTGG